MCWLPKAILIQFQTSFHKQITENSLFSQSGLALRWSTYSMHYQKLMFWLQLRSVISSLIEAARAVETVLVKQEEQDPTEHFAEITIIYSTSLKYIICLCICVR